MAEFYIDSSMVLRQRVELEASTVLRQWVELLASATLRQFSHSELEATCIIRQLAPEIPVGLVALDMKKGDSILLNWDENTEPNVLFYRIYKRDNSEWIFVGQTKKPPYQVGGLQKGQTYYFAVSAVIVGLEGTRWIDFTIETWDDMTTQRWID